MGVDDQGYHPKCTTHRFKQGSLYDTNQNKALFCKGEIPQNTTIQSHCLLDSQYKQLFNCFRPPTLKDIQTSKHAVNHVNYPHKTK